MRLRSKVAVTLLAGALGVPLAFAQAPAGQADDQAGPGGAPPPAKRMGSGRDGRGDGPGREWKRHGEGRYRGMRGRRGRHGRGREFMVARLAASPEARERLGITAEQADKIQRQTDDFRKAQIRGRADLQLKQLELRELMRGETPDRAAIDRKMDELSAARAAQAKAEAHYRLDMRASLTAEQRQKLHEMMERGGRRGRDGADRPGRAPGSGPGSGEGQQQNP